MTLLLWNCPTPFNIKVIRHLNINSNFQIYVLSLEHIKPICILLQPKIIEVNDFVGTGWRVPQFRFSTHDLRPIFMQRVDGSFCTEKTEVALAPTQFCAKNPNPVTMEGPAGSALYRKVVLDGVVRVIQLGIGSYNQHDFGDTRIFTNVLSFSSWIQSVVMNKTD